MKGRAVSRHFVTSGGKEAPCPHQEGKGGKMEGGRKVSNKGTGGGWGLVKPFVHAFTHLVPLPALGGRPHLLFFLLLLPWPLLLLPLPAPGVAVGGGGRGGGRGGGGGAVVRELWLVIWLVCLVGYLVGVFVSVGWCVVSK